MWYANAQNNIRPMGINVDTSKIASNSGLAAKAIGDAFLGVVGVVEDRKKLDILEADAKARNEKNQFDLSKAYGETTQKAIDDTYLGYVDTNTGKFNKEQFDKDNVGLPMNQVSMDARLKQKQLENAYSVDLEKIDKKAQEEISNEVVKEMYKYGSKEEFNKNVNPDLIRYANGTTMLAVDKFYNDATVQEAKLANAAAKIENTIAMGNSKLENEKLKVQIEQEKLDNKKNKPKEVKAADDSLIGKNIATYFGGTFNPATGEITGLDKEAAKKVNEYQAKASKYYKDNPDITHNEASALAVRDYEATVKNPTPKEENITDPFNWNKK